MTIMAKKKKSAKKNKKYLFKRGKEDSCSSSGGFCGSYLLGIIGAAVYYLSTASGFWAGVLGILKSLVWPAFLVFEVLKYISA